MKNLTPEMIEKAKAAASAQELLALAKENGVEMSEDGAKICFAQLNTKRGELTDDELDDVAGGGCSVKENGKRYTVVTSYTSCFTGEFERGVKIGTSTSVTPFRQDHKDLRKTWACCTTYKEECGKCYHLEFDGATGYCGKSGR